MFKIFIIVLILSATTKCCWSREDFLLEEQVLDKISRSLDKISHDSRAIDHGGRENDQQKQNRRYHRDYLDQLECDRLALIGDIHSVISDLQALRDLPQFRGGDRKTHPTQRWYFVPFNRPTVNLPGKIVEVTLTMHKLWLANMAESSLAYCSGKEKCKSMNVHIQKPKSILNRWYQYDMSDLFAYYNVNLTAGEIYLAYRRKNTPQGQNMQFKPHLHIKVCQEKQSSSSENSINNNFCQPGVSNRNQPCCLETVEIDFRKHGWNSIENPKKVILHTCRGHCPLQYLAYASDKRRLFESFLNGTRLPIGKLCCVAEGYRPVEIQTTTAVPSITRSIILNDIDVTSCSCKF